MAQMGFFDLSDRYASLAAKRDPLVEIDAVVPWEEFRPALVNRPGCPRGLFVQNSGGFFKSIHLCMEFVLQFLRRPMAIGAV